MSLVKRVGYLCGAGNAVKGNPRFFKPLLPAVGALYILVRELIFTTLIQMHPYTHSTRDIYMYEMVKI